MSDTGRFHPTSSIINTGFRRHIDLCVSGDGVRPAEHLEKAARNMLGVKEPIEKWFDVTGLGYDTNWMWVLGY